MRPFLTNAVSENRPQKNSHSVKIEYANESRHVRDKKIAKQLLMTKVQIGLSKAKCKLAIDVLRNRVTEAN